MTESLTKQEMKTLIELCKKVLWSDYKVRQKIQEHKINITPANFYSDVPLVDDILNSFEYQKINEEVYNSRIFDKGNVQDFIKNILSYADEFNPQVDKGNENSFYWKNPAFSYADAMAYYCIIRHYKPNKILEIGSGFSTIVANEALLKNNNGGGLILIEPYPKDFLYNLEAVEQIIKKFVQDIPSDELISLIETVDIWFIDSTHTVKIGSDCLYIYLKIMPEIKKNILVHTHDVYLPFGMPQKKALDLHIYWTEQYLLYAYMLDNPKIKVLFGSFYAKKCLSEYSQKLMNGKYGDGGGSIWYELNGLSEHD